jgi:hypothetical protein
VQARRPARGPAFCVSHPARGVCRLPSSKHAPPADAPARALASALTSQLRQLPSYCTVAAGGASTQASRVAPRRHSFALGCGFGSPIVCGSIGRRNSRPPGTRGRWLVCLRGGRHRPRSVERHHEQARMVEHVDRSARDGQSTHRVARARRAVRPNFAPSPGRGLSLSSASMSRSSR